MDRSAVAAVAALHDDVRRSLYEYVRAAREPVTREAAADGVGISGKLAAFHLDKLVELGLLTSHICAARTGRVGRAPRMYEPASADITVRVPERTPELLAAILIDAIAGEGERDARQAAMCVAREHGAAAGADARARMGRPGRLGVERAAAIARDALSERGFEPYACGAAIRLRNCPFHPLTSRARNFVCNLNREYVDGVIDGMGACGRLVAELAPRDGECCVEIRPAES